MKCVINGCGRVVSSRGLCASCYQTARKKIIAGSISWKFLEDAGLAIPVCNKGPGKGAFKKALQDLPGQMLIPELNNNQ